MLVTLLRDGLFYHDHRFLLFSNIFISLNSHVLSSVFYLEIYVQDIPYVEVREWKG